VWCGYARTGDCDVSTLPDGSRLATGTAQPAPGAVSYLACLRRPDGTMVLMQVSNQEAPGVLSPTRRAVRPTRRGRR
jgi:hypothetical protein